MRFANLDNILAFQADLGALLEAKKLLDDILCYRDRYSCNFNIPKHEQEYNSLYPSLLSRIERYENFDDSE